MRGIALVLSALTVAALAQTPAGRLARWKPVQMPFHTEGLSAKERQMVDKLVDASRLLNDVYWRQSDRAGLALYKSTQDPTLRRLFAIMGSRWDLLDENRPFADTEPMPPGHDLYPHDLTRARLDQYLKRHPEDKDAIYNPYTVVKWRGNRLIGVPYHEEYREFLEPMAKDLREAAALSDDAAFAKFLRLRADALLTDDYYRERPRLARPPEPEVRRDLRAVRDVPGRFPGRQDLLRRLPPGPQ